MRSDPLESNQKGFIFKIRGMDPSALVISDFDKICRLCLNRDRPLTCLFSHGQYEVPLHLMTQTCATVDIDEDDGLPPNICCACRDTILASYQFRETVCRNDTILRCIAGIKPDPDGERLVEAAAENERGDSKQYEAENSHQPHDVLGGTGYHFLAEDETPVGKDTHRECDDTATVGTDEKISKDQPSIKPFGVKNAEDNFKSCDSDESVRARMLEYGTPVADGSGYCFVCQKVFCKFYEHVQLKHLVTSGFWCDHCDVWCKSKNGLDWHIESKHINANEEMKTDGDSCEGRSSLLRTKKRGLPKDSTNEYMCDQCGYRTYAKGRLNAHIKTIHAANHDQNIQNALVIEEVRAKMSEYGTRNPDGSYYCRPCEKFYPRVAYYLHVKTIHLQIRDFMCEECGYRAATKILLIQHIDGIHLRVRKYKCTHCPLRFFTKGKLNDHVRKHRPGGVRKFMCEVCGKSCRSPRDIKRHLRAQHFPELKIKCDFCDCRYASSGKLREHLKKSH